MHRWTWPSAGLKVALRPAPISYSAHWSNPLVRIGLSPTAYLQPRLSSVRWDTLLPLARDGKRLVVPVEDTRRIEAIAWADLHSHLADTDLHSVVWTLATACRVPISIVNIVTPGRQSYAAEIGAGTEHTTIDDGVSFSAAVVRTGEPLSVSDASEHPIFKDNPLVLSGRVRAYAGEPLIDNGIVIGTVAILDKRVRTFTDEELQLLHHQTRLASDVLALRRAARVDELTGLPNKAILMDRLCNALKRSSRTGKRVGVFFIDVDGFKAINDRLGHVAGDRYLVELSDRLSQAIRPGDTFARFGGDEFVIVCDDVTSKMTAQILAERLISCVDGPEAATAGASMHISIGVAFAQDCSLEPEAVLAMADEAMYRAKRKEGSSWAIAADSTDSADSTDTEV